MKDKQNTKYVDLRGPRITDSYRPSPASDPTEVYYARLGVTPDGSHNFIQEVYKLVTKESKGTKKGIEKRFVQGKDGKYLVEIINHGEIFETLRDFYDDLYEGF